MALKILGEIGFIIGFAVLILLPLWLADIGKWRGPR